MIFTLLQVNQVVVRREVNTRFRERPLQQVPIPVWVLP